MSTGAESQPCLQHYHLPEIPSEIRGSDPGRGHSAVRWRSHSLQVTIRAPSAWGHVGSDDANKEKLEPVTMTPHTRNGLRSTVICVCSFLFFERFRLTRKV